MLVFFFLNSIVLHTTFIHCYCFNLSPFVLTSACHTTFMIGHPCQFCIIAKLKAELQKHTIHRQLSSKKHQQGPCVSSHSTFFCCPRALTLSFLCPCFTCYYSSWNSESQHFSSCALAFLLISLLSHPYPLLFNFFSSLHSYSFSFNSTSSVWSPCNLVGCRDTGL